eukprot:Platyproteum_vivax@DN588_c0_g1_i1.p1
MDAQTAQWVLHGLGPTNAAHGLNPLSVSASIPSSYITYAPSLSPQPAKPKFQRPEGVTLPMLLKRIITVLKETRLVMTRVSLSTKIDYKIGKDPELLEAMQNNPNIHYDSSRGGTYAYMSKFDTITDANALLARLRSEPDGMIVDDELLDCYANIDEEITQLLQLRKCFGLRRSGPRKIEKKCPAIQEEGATNPGPNRVWGCNLYGKRCEHCGKTNKDLVLFPLDPEIDTEQIRLDDDLRALWQKQVLPNSMDDVCAELNLQQRSRDISHLRIQPKKRRRVVSEHKGSRLRIANVHLMGRGESSFGLDDLAKGNIVPD